MSRDAAGDGPDGWEAFEEGAARARFLVSLDRQQLEDLRGIAEREKRPVAELVRRAVSEFLERQPPR